MPIAPMYGNDNFLFVADVSKWDSRGQRDHCESGDAAKFRAVPQTSVPVNLPAPAAGQVLLHLRLSQRRSKTAIHRATSSGIAPPPDRLPIYTTGHA